MIEHAEKLTIYSPIKIKIITISDQVKDWENLAFLTGSFALSMVKNSGEQEKLPELNGGLLDVINLVNDFDPDNYKLAIIEQTVRTNNDEY